MMTLNLLFLLAGLLCTSTEAWTSQHAAKDFDFLLLAHFWPTSSCIFFDNEHKGCLVPPGVKGWTIHGLWPSINGEKGPQYCNDSMKFDYNQIKSLAQRLAIDWPYYEKGGEKTELWDHEWFKHGTCAYTLPILKGELKFFNQTLNLHDKLNLSKILSDTSIIPSDDKTYEPEAIFEAVKKGTGWIPNITCLTEQKTGLFHLEQIWLCYDKQLQPINCPGVSTTRRLSSTLYFESNIEQEKSTPYHSYMQGCPSSGTVHYKPIPRN